MPKRWEPERYSKTKEFRIRALQKFIEWAGFDFNQDLNILDIGCGNGMLDRYLCETYPSIHILGTDIDTDMLTSAQAETTLANLHFQQINALDINFKNEFDVTISTACLHWIKDQAKLLANTYQALKPGGQVLFLIYPSPLFVFEALDILTKEKQWQQYFINFDHGYYFYNEHNYNELAKTAGFIINKIEITKIDNKFKNATEFKNTLASWLPHLQQLPEAQHQQFLIELSDIILTLMQQDGLKDFSDRRSILLNIHLTKPQ